MNSNPAIQIDTAILWDGAAAGDPAVIINHNQIGFDFTVSADIATDAVFNVFYHEPSAADPCVPGPAIQAQETVICLRGEEGDLQVTIPAGTTAGSKCAAGLTCIPGKFLSLAAVSGDTANVKVVMVMKGPHA